MKWEIPATLKYRRDLNTGLVWDLDYVDSTVFRLPKETKYKLYDLKK
jgi:hypothetical protein